MIRLLVGMSAIGMCVVACGERSIPKGPAPEYERVELEPWPPTSASAASAAASPGVAARDAGTAGTSGSPPSAPGVIDPAANSR